jgi:uncharacterized protein YqgC (DUF456 family)
MLTIGLALGGIVVGGYIGIWIGESQGGEYNFAPAIYAPFGALIGCLAGTIIGEIVSR